LLCKLKCIGSSNHKIRNYTTIKQNYVQLCYFYDICPKLTRFILPDADKIVYHIITFFALFVKPQMLNHAPGRILSTLQNLRNTCPSRAETYIQLYIRIRFFKTIGTRYDPQTNRSMADCCPDIYIYIYVCNMYRVIYSVCIYLYMYIRPMMLDGPLMSAEYLFTSRCPRALPYTPAATTAAAADTRIHMTYIYYRYAGGKCIILIKR